MTRLKAAMLVPGAEVGRWTRLPGSRERAGEGASSGICLLGFDPAASRTAVVALRITEKMIAAVDEWAGNKGMSRSAVIRHIIERALSSREE
jgi:hypothetical protein